MPLYLGQATTTAMGYESATDKSRNDNWFNVAFYNVLDNGISPSNSAAANVTAWDALLASIADNSTIFFPPGTMPYQFASVCAIPAGKHVRVMGGGNQKTIIQTTSATADIFTCGDWYNEFWGLYFTSSVTRSAGAAIVSGNNVAINVYDCDFSGMFNGIDYSGGIQSGNLAIVRNCHFTNTVNFSIRMDGTNANAFIVECVADGTPAAVAHLEINACGSLLIANCDWIRATNNMRLNPNSGTKGVFSVYCTNVFFDTAAGSSVKFLGGATGTNIQRIKFVNCWFSGSVTGCEFAAVTSTNKATAVDFTNCDIYGNSAFGVLATEVQDFSMSNCRIAGNTTAGIRTNAATGSVTKFNIQNNTIGPTAGFGANGIGLDIVAGTYGGYNVTGNNVVGNTSNNNLIDAGSVATTDLKIIEDNLGHLVKGQIASQGGTPLSVPVTTETLVLNARIPPNSVIVGQVFRLRAIGVTSGANVCTWRVRVGAAGTVAGDTAVAFVSKGVTSAANDRSWCDILLTVRSLGGPGSCQAEGTVGAVATINTAVAAVAATSDITTTAAWFMDITLSQTVGTALIQHAVIEAL